MSQQIFIAVLVVAFLSFWWLKRPTITSAAAREAVAAGAHLVDVRSAGEFAAGHLPGAVNVPVDQLRSRLGELGEKSVPVVVYCASGARSAMAARTLKANGFASVRNLGALSNW